MAGPHDIEWDAARHDGGDRLVAAVRGEATTATVATLRVGLEKLLAEGLPVLLDVSGLRLAWAPAPEVFVTAVNAAGGWPSARLVLFGADTATTDRLTACRVAESIPLAATAVEAAGLVGTRPARLARGRTLAPGPRAVAAARGFLAATLDQWGLAAQPDAAEVVAELAANAVTHAGTPFRLRLVLDDSGLRVSVRDGRPGFPPGPPSGRPGRTPGPAAAGPARAGGRGLQHVARLSHSWGVVHYADGKSVWALLPVAARARGLAPRPVDRGLATGAGDGPVAAVTAPRRQRYVTADPERAHEFLRGLYGEHTLHLSGAADFPGFQLVYEGRSTNRFTVERLAHTMPFEGRFAPAPGLVVLHPVGGDLRVAVRADRLRVEPGDDVLVDLGAGPQVAWTNLDTEAVRLDEAAVALVAADLTGVAPDTVRFELGRPVSAARAALWTATVRHLRDDVLPNDEAMASPLARSAAFRHLVATLVETFPGPVLQALSTASVTGGVAPAAMRRAVRFIEEHAGDDITLADVAAAARLGVRGLQLAFRRHHDVTPLEYLRRVRLERAHRDLQAGNPVDDTVGAIAARWGFAHHGNFSAAYRRTYGRSPRTTLQS